MSDGAAGTAAKTRILVVDDEQSIRLALDRALSAVGHVVGVAVNGTDALQQLSAAEWDIVLLDIRMPDLDGLAVLRKARESWPDLPVVMITAYGSVPSAVEAMKLGAVDYLEKPFTNQQIAELVKEILARPSLQADSEDPGTLLELSKAHIQHQDFDKARNMLRNVIALDPSRAEAYNLLGVLHEMGGETAEARRLYRAALALDPSYRAADNNLTRMVQLSPGATPFDLGDTDKDKKERPT